MQFDSTTLKYTSSPTRRVAAGRYVILYYLNISLLKKLLTIATHSTLYLALHILHYCYRNINLLKL